PVRAATRASHTSVTVPASTSTLTFGSTTVSGSVCASGISSSVRLAAWIAAIRATVATSPLGASPAATRAAASDDIRTTARARAPAAEALECDVTVEDFRLSADRELTTTEADFLAALGHILGGTSRAHHHDPLTGLPNRVLLEDRTTGALARLRRGSWRVALL